MTDDAMPRRARILIRAMAVSMVATIATTLLAGLHAIPGWTPIVPSTMVTMSIGAALVQTERMVPATTDAGARASVRFALWYGWAMIVGSPAAALAVALF